LKQAAGIGVMAGFGVSMAGCNSEQWRSFFRKNYRLMNEEERQLTIQRLEQRAVDNCLPRPSISSKPAIPGTLYGYAFNVSKCKSYLDCIAACVRENNLDRRSQMQYIHIFSMRNNQLGLPQDTPPQTPEQTASKQGYIGMQCFQCENHPCVNVCPVGATWKEPDGIVVVDYDWCIGCRYCQAACPYAARYFNWREPHIPPNQINTKQHYLGNRLRENGVVEKCTFCIQRVREGLQPACVEACPTGARIFGNLLDPDSEIRYVLANKKVFRFKENLQTEPKFWYFAD
jgi:molybdopterin-containing oxidoreductase family iron-sulfur binding subunit